MSDFMDEDVVLEELMYAAVERLQERMQDDLAGFAIVGWDATGMRRECAMFSEETLVPPDLLPDLVRAVVANTLAQLACGMDE